MIKDDIKAQMIAAMKNKDSETLSTIRLIMAKIKDFEVANRSTGKEVDDAVILQILQQMLKQRYDSITEYKKANREELAAKEEQEVVLIKTFMPPQLSESEIVSIIEKIIIEIQAQGQKDIGKVIALVKEKHASEVDMALVGKLVKDKLGN